MNPDLLHPDRLFPIEDKARIVARDLYSEVASLPIVSPHGHTDASWFAEDTPFSDAVDLLIRPDHYILRMLYSQGLSLENFGVFPKDKPHDLSETERKKIWKLFAQNFYLFRATPSAFWLKHVFHEIFSIDKEFHAANADYFYDVIKSQLATPSFRPRALFDRFKIEVLATTDAATDSLIDHQKIREDWPRRILPTYRPDGVIDPEHEDFKANLVRFGELTNEDVSTWRGYLRAHRARREFFKSAGATATDHGHPSAATLALSDAEAESLFRKVNGPRFTSADAEAFRAHMLWQMASMSIDDGLVMQIHPGSYRNHNPWLMKTFGRDKGADIPIAMEYTRNLKPLLDSFGNDPKLRVILFTLDESTYSRELAPLAGHYPALRLGPAWWFQDSPEGMLRQRQQTIETAGFYNVTGFIDDTRAFFSIPARHDMARRVDARLLSQWVCEHRLSMSEAQTLIRDIHSTHAKACFRL
jgi:glucuronate isomerase